MSKIFTNCKNSFDWFQEAIREHCGGDPTPVSQRGSRRVLVPLTIPGFQAKALTGPWIEAILVGKTGQQMICFLHIKELTHSRVTKRASYPAIEGHLTERFHTIIRER